VSTGLLERAEAIFAPATLPAEFAWVALLSANHLRLFAGEFLAAARRNASDDEVTELLEAWEATAELDGAQDAVEEIRKPKRRLPLAGFVNS